MGEENAKNSQKRGCAQGRSKYTKTKQARRACMGPQQSIYTHIRSVTGRAQTENVIHTHTAHPCTIPLNALPDSIRTLRTFSWPSSGGREPAGAVQGNSHEETKKHHASCNAHEPGSRKHGRKPLAITMHSGARGCGRDRTLTPVAHCFQTQTTDSAT